MVEPASPTSGLMDSFSQPLSTEDKARGIWAYLPAHYETKRVVLIQDRSLALGSFITKVAIFCYIFFYTILYKQEHLKADALVGTARMTIQRPTHGGCNPDKAECESVPLIPKQFPYCSESNASLGVDEHGKPIHRLPCVFMGVKEMVPEGILGAEFLIPTRVSTILQDLKCDENDFCAHKTTGGQTDEYVVGVEKYTMLFMHSFMAGAAQGDQYYAEGWAEACETYTPTRTGCREKRIPCLGWHGTAHDENAAACDVLDKPPEYGFFSIPYGDVFTVDALIKLAGLNIDRRRGEGADILLFVTYSNEGFGFFPGPIKYTYSVAKSSGPSTGASKKRVSDGGFVNAKKHDRAIIDEHGLYLKIIVGGKIASFDFTHLFIVLNTSIGMLALSTLVVDNIAKHFMKSKDEYTQVMHMKTKDYSLNKSSVKEDVSKMLLDRDEWCAKVRHTDGQAMDALAVIAYELHRAKIPDREHADSYYVNKSTTIRLLNGKVQGEVQADQGRVIKTGSLVQFVNGERMNQTSKDITVEPNHEIIVSKSYPTDEDLADICGEAHVSQAFHRQKKGPAKDSPLYTSMQEKA